MRVPSLAAHGLRVASALVATLALAAAQTGVLDQVSPAPGSGQAANFAVSDPAQIWQQQVRANVAGKLTAIEVELTGPATARAMLRIRPAAGWTSVAPVVQRWLQKSAAGAQTMLVDVSAANFQLALGQRFVIELQGDGSLAGVNGSYTPTTLGPAQYGEPLFLGGPGCYAGCGWRIGFRTWVSNGDVTEFCFGASCPCGNDASASGCVNSSGFGAKLARASGSTSASADDLVLDVAHLPANVSTLLFLGSAQVLAPFADGLRCAGGSPHRIQLAQSSPSGVASFTNSVARSGGLVTAGSTWHFQVWFRDPLGPCASGFGLSSALQVVFAP